MSVSFSPIGPWMLVLLAALLVMVLTVWAYQQRLKGTSGRWRWFALGLRLAAVILCVLAALRPSVILQEKKKQPSVIVFLIDDSSSMKLTDAVGGGRRFDQARATLEKARAQVRKLGPNIESRVYSFADTVRELSPDDKEKVADPKGAETALGAAMLEVAKRNQGTRITGIVLESDGASNAGINALVAAQRLKAQEVPVYTVGFGSESAGPNSRDVAIRELIAGPTVFVKNKLEVRGSLVVRGFPNQSIDVAMYIEGQTDPVAETHYKVPEGSESVIKLSGLKYIPQTPGEKKLTLKVKPMQGELVQTNNEVSTFISVLSGGLNVLFLQGPHSPWEHKFMMRAIAQSPDIQADLQILRRPAEGGPGELADEDLAPGKYNVYILSDLGADFLTPAQQLRLRKAIRDEGAGMMMLGGRSSFGPGGWAGTPVAEVLPVDIHPGDGQVEPPDGIRFEPATSGLENYLFQVGANRAESKRIWASLPALTGASRFGNPKLGAMVLAQTPPPNPEPLMVCEDIGAGRTMAFGGETWVWARASDEGRAAHRKFWRQIIFWLAHKEDQGDDKVNIKLEQRRIARGQKLEMSITARDAKNAPIPDLQYTTVVTREGDKGPGEPIDPFPAERDSWRASYFAMGQPGDYKVTVTAKRDGKEIGHDSARFLVYQDDREMENPAADLHQLRQIAMITGGEFLAPENLIKDYLAKLDGKIQSEYVTQKETKIWDNWPFFLIFTAILTLEWWLRKKNGWV